MASSVLMRLGAYTFALNQAAYQQLQRSSAYRWPGQARLGRLPAQQYLGPGEETLSLEGALYPHFKGGLKQLEDMRREADKGQPLMLTDGRGHIWQHWVITQVDETHRVLFENGTPRKIAFRLHLARYGEDMRRAEGL